MRATLPLMLLVACAEKEPTTAGSPTTDTTPPPTTDTETDTPPVDTDDTEPPVTDSGTTAPTGDTGPTTTPPACDTLNSGMDWAWRGSCPGMLTPCEILVTGCDLDIQYSSGMTMGMPTVGLVAGSDVTFNNNGVPGCVGTVTDPDSIEGTCDGGSCSFTLTR